jgi:hypothetical protein
MNDRFPILGSKPAQTIPWAMLEPRAKQAEKNHGQTLRRLAERGGLSWPEAFAILKGTDYYELLKPERDPAAAEAAVKALVVEWEAKQQEQK